MQPTVFSEWSTKAFNFWWKKTEKSNYSLFLWQMLTHMILHSKNGYGTFNVKITSNLFFVVWPTWWQAMSQIGHFSKWMSMPGVNDCLYELWSLTLKFWSTHLIRASGIAVISWWIKFFSSSLIYSLHLKT